MKDARLLKRERFSPLTYLALAAALLMTMILCETRLRLETQTH